MAAVCLEVRMTFSRSGFSFFSVFLPNSLLKPLEDFVEGFSGIEPVRPRSAAAIDVNQPGSDLRDVTDEVLPFRDMFGAGVLECSVECLRSGVPQPGASRKVKVLRLEVIVATV